MAPMDETATTANRFNELPNETQEFLSQLRKEDLATLKDGLRLVNAIGIVGKFFKWCIVGLLGMLAGVVMFGESIIKIVAWFRPPN